MLIKSILPEDRLSKLNGTTTPHLYQRDIADFPIHLPSIEEQERILNVLDETFEGIATVRSNTEARLGMLDELQKSLLNKAFNGEL